MSHAAILQIIVFIILLFAVTKPLGAYMARVYEGEPTLLAPLLGPIERLLYRAAGVRPDEGMTWRVYALAMLAFSAASVVVV